MVKIKFEVRGMEETLQFWRHGNKPLKWEGRVGSDLVYALRMHEEPHPAKHMLERDAEKIAAGISPLTGGKYGGGKRRREAALRGIAANLALLHTPTPEGMPGRKYLTRVVETHAKMYIDSADKILPHAVALMARSRGIALEDAISLIAEQFLGKVVSHITQRAADNAPFWHGDLRASLTGYIANKLIARGPEQKSLAHWVKLMEDPPNVKQYTKEGALLLASLARE